MWRKQVPGRQHAAAEKVHGEVECVNQRRQKYAERFTHDAKNFVSFRGALVRTLRDIVDFLGGKVVTELQQTSHGAEGSGGAVFFHAALAAASAWSALWGHCD